MKASYASLRNAVPCLTQQRRLSACVGRQVNLGHLRHFKQRAQCFNSEKLRGEYPDDDGVEQLLSAVLSQEGPYFDVLGLGQAMVDLSVAVTDDMLISLEVKKGSRKIVSLEERTKLMQFMDSDSYQVSAGGSLSNSLMALAQLSAAANKSSCRQLHVALAGIVGSDPLGSFFTAQMSQAGVEVVSKPVDDAHTGTVMVLTSPDAQRTMLSYLGTSCELTVDACLEATIARSRMLVIEGYLWELPGAAVAISKAIRVAKAHGTLVVMTAGDSGVVERHHRDIWRTLNQGIDMLFTNKSEAEVLCQSGLRCANNYHMDSSVLETTAHLGAAEAAALQLGPHCSMVCVTDGSHGSVITALGQLYTVPPSWGPAKPVDTCGAGDAYAAGVLYGFLIGHDIPNMGRMGAKAASAVISHLGSALTLEQADMLVNSGSWTFPQRSVNSWNGFPAEMP